MKESWSNHVRQEQQRVFNDLGADRYHPEGPSERWWEYVRIAEPHKRGYAHHHIAILTNFEIDVETFEPVITRHVKETPSANWSAHSMDADDPEDQCVSINRIDPETTDQEDIVGNLATYLSGYLSEFGEDGEYVRMIQKPPAEVMFAATAWATGSRRVDYSNGGHNIKSIGYALRPEKYKNQESDGDCPAPTSVRNTKTEEEYEILEPGGVETAFVEEQPQVDPEKVFVAGTLEATR